MLNSVHMFFSLLALTRLVYICSSVLFNSFNEIRIFFSLHNLKGAEHLSFEIDHRQEGLQHYKQLTQNMHQEFLKHLLAKFNHFPRSDL